jgi:hypothetical protein
MLPQHVLVALVAAVSAVPLNINLGAYSPALVVGDGEISMGSPAETSQLMSTLASGAANGEGQARGQQEQAAEAPPAEQPAEQPAAPAEGEQQAEGEAAAKRSNLLARAVETFLTKRAPEPRPEAEQLAAVENAMQWIKRDLAGFNAALDYAKDAMKNTPKIELGTEEAGVGIVQSPGLNVPANSAANGERPAGEKVKREEVVDEETETPKMTLVAITEV